MQPIRLVLFDVQLVSNGKSADLTMLKFRCVRNPFNQNEISVVILRFHTVAIDLECAVSAVKPWHIVQIERIGAAFVLCRITDTGSQGTINQRQFVHLAAAFLPFAGLINGDHGPDHRVNGVLIAFVQLPVLGDQIGFTLRKSIPWSFQAKELLQRDTQHIANHGKKADKIGRAHV